MSKVIVTGASGFIGALLVEKLLSKNYQVISLGSKNGSILDSAYLSPYEHDDISHFFHLAAATYVPDSWNTPRDFYHVNLMGTVNALEFCRKKNIPITYVSAYVYGIPNEIPTDEKAEVSPNNPYASSKYLAENICEFYSKNFNMSCTVLRPFNIYGLGQRESFLIPTIINQALFSNEITVDNLSPKRDYLNVKDLIQALVLTMSHIATYQIFNIGSGHSLSVEMIIEVIQSELGTYKPIKSRNIVRMNEIPNVVADISYAKKELNWQPQISFEQGIKELISVHKSAAKQLY